MLPKSLSLATLLLWMVASGNVSSKSVPVTNDRPIIGIIAEETNTKYSPFGSSYIASSYVKFVEAGGARVVPIMIYETEEYYRNIFSKINGVLFTGGGDYIKSKGYGRTGRILYDLAVKANKNGDYFPVWGTCLGFELLNYIAGNNTLWMKQCDGEDVAASLNLTSAYSTSRMFQDASTNLTDIVRTKPVTINFHRWCITPQNYSLSGLDKVFKILSLSKDSTGLQFISVIEGYQYPFYGVAFHPEKVLFEWVNTKSYKNIPHTYEAVFTSQHFANFFVNEARRNNHVFESKGEEDQALIYNYQPLFTGKKNFSLDQIYFFQ